MTPQALLADLRRRIERIERRPAPAPRRRLRLEDLPGARREPSGLVVVESRLGAEERVGVVAPADAVIAAPDLAAPLAGLPTPAPRDLLHGLRVLDIETTGLSGGAGTLAFLVGVGRFDADASIVVEQLVLPSPAGEPALLDRLRGLLEGATLLVTFNGRSFDAPVLRTRYVMSRKSSAALDRLPHLDLLPASRRLFRARSGDCRLITLEERVLGRVRPCDAPGSLAPIAYASYLSSSDPTPLAAMLAHNRDDVLGTAALLAAVLRALESPLEWAEDAAEMLAVGEHRLRLGAAAEALPVLERALDLARAPEVRRRALTQLARLHRRAGRAGEARAAWDRYRCDFPRENLGFVEVAKLLEHQQRDPAAALAVMSAVPQPGFEEVQRRLARLRRRVERV